MKSDIKNYQSNIVVNKYNCNDTQSVISNTSSNKDNFICSTADNLKNNESSSESDHKDEEIILDQEFHASSNISMEKALKSKNKNQQ